VKKWKCGKFFSKLHLYSRGENYDEKYFRIAELTQINKNDVFLLGEYISYIRYIFTNYDK